MTRTLIYLIAVFALWLYFKYGNFSEKESTSHSNEQGFAGKSGKF